MRNNGVTIMMFGQLLVTQEPTEDDYKLVLTVKQRGGGIPWKTRSAKLSL